MNTKIPLKHTIFYFAVAAASCYAQSITPVSSDFNLTTGQGNSFLNTLTGYDAQGGTKLIALVSWESGATSIDTITFGSQTFSDQSVIGSGAGRTFTIWYLDNPNAGANDVTVSFIDNGTGANPSSGTESRLDVLSFTSLQAGGPINQSSGGEGNNSISGAVTASLVTTFDDALIIGGYVRNNGGAVTSSFESTIYNGDSGSSTTSSGYSTQDNIGTFQVDFSPNSSNQYGYALASFATIAAIPEPSTYGVILGAFGLLFASLRRRKIR